MIFRSARMPWSWRAFGGGALAVLIGVPLAGVLLALISLPYVPVDVPYGEFHLGRTLQDISFIMMFSPLLSIFGLIAAIPLGAIALRIGFAGWGSAISVAGGLGICAAAASPGTRVAIVGAFFAAYGLVFWLGARWLEPRLGGSDITPD